MLCKNPYMKGLKPFGCGQCHPCRHNRRRLWTHRIMLETLTHSESCFITLTYNEQNLPKGGTLVPKDYQKFLYKLRKNIYPHRIRYFFVGEYGDHSNRPHYHAAIFGLGPSSSELIDKCWDHGFTYTGTLTFDSAQYIAGYVTKKLNGRDERSRSILGDRYPEFSRPSLKPGLGAIAMKDLANVLASDAGCNDMLVTGDVPLALKHGPKQYPLGRYLRNKLRDELGYDKEKIKAVTIPQYETQMRELYQTLSSNQKSTKISSKIFNRSPSEEFKKLLLTENQQKVLNMETRHKIFNGVKKI